MITKIEEQVEKWRELWRSEIEHLEARFGFELVEDTPFGLELPYKSLGGPGFERLCYHVLVSEGKAPRFYEIPGLNRAGFAGGSNS